ncbi:kelch motif domain-containing protein [Ditylenchus destructor]|nr:kelch motif domain-containing protein [Ditylenchus destructor]
MLIEQSIAHGIWKRDESDITKDAVIIAKNGITQFKVHSVVILAKWPSPGNISDADSDNLTQIQTLVDPELLDYVVDYCYNISFREKGIRLSLEGKSMLIYQLLQLARNLGIHGLFDDIVDFLVAEMTPTDCIRLWQFCKKFNVHRHAFKVHDYLLYNLAPNFSESLLVDWLQLSVADIYNILSDSYLNIHSEFEVFHLIKMWIDADISRKPYFGDLLHLVRLNTANEIEELKVRYAPSLDNVSTICYILGLPKRVQRDVVLLVGGTSSNRNRNIQPIGNVTSYCEEERMWKDYPMLSMPFEAVSGHALVTLNKNIYFIGGIYKSQATSAVFMLDSNTKEWNRVAPMNDKRSKPCAAVLNGHIYVMGGTNSEGSLNTTEKYDPSNNQWTILPEMNSPRLNAAAVTIEGTIYVFGGATRTEILDTVEMLDDQPKNGGSKWIVLHHTMKSPREGHRAIKWNGAIMIAGGTNTSGVLSSVEMFAHPFNSIIANMSIPNMLNARMDFAFISYRGEAYAIGGSALARKLSAVEKFDGTIWIENSSLPFERWSLQACIVPDAIELLKEKQWKRNSKNPIESD